MVSNDIYSLTTLFCAFFNTQARMHARMLTLTYVNQINILNPAQCLMFAFTFHKHHITDV